MENKRLYRTEGAYKMLAGVCGGSVGFWAYLICALIMPKKSDIYPGY